MKKGNNIHQFDPIIYPVKLWVTVTGNVDELKSKFVHYPSYKKLSSKIMDDADACVNTVTNTNNNTIGILVIFRDLNALSSGVIAHESTHVSDRIWKRIGEYKKGTEANAYLVEWIVKCIESVKSVEFETSDKKQSIGYK